MFWMLYVNNINRCVWPTSLATVVLLSFVAPSLAQTARPADTPNGSSVAEPSATDRAALVRHELSQLQSYRLGDDATAIESLERLVLQVPPNDPQRSEIESELLTSLQGNLSTDVKRLVAAMLTHVATPKSIGELEPLLLDPELAHLARRTLSRLDDAEADAAMLRALEQATGDIRIGLLLELAQRQYRPAQSITEQLASSDNRREALAAISGLGMHGGPGAVRVLLDLKTKAQPSTESAQATELEKTAAIDRALLACAEHFQRSGERDAAIRIYRDFWDQNDQRPLKLAGLRGLVMLDAIEPRLVIDLIAQDAEFRRDCLALIPLLKPGSFEVTRQVAALLPHLAAENQAILIDALAKRRDTAAAHALLELLAEDQTPVAVRMAAIEALASCGDASATERLLMIASQGAADERPVAQQSLAGLQGPNVDEVLVARLQARDGLGVLEAIRALVDRNSPACRPALVSSTRDSRADVRRAALAGLTRVGELDDIRILISVLANPRHGPQHDLAEQALGGILSRAPDAGEALARIDAAMTDDSATLRPVLVRRLASIGSAAAMERADGYLSSDDESVELAAVQALSSWPQAGASERLVKFAQTTKSDRLRHEALQGVLRQATPDTAGVRQLLDLTRKLTGDGERKLLLAAVGQQVGSDAAALTEVLQYLDQPPLQATAGLAALRIANRLRDRDQQLARESLQRVVSEVGNADVQQRAREVLNELDRFEDHIVQWKGVGPFQAADLRDGRLVYEHRFEPETNELAEDKWLPVTTGVSDWNLNLEQAFGNLDYAAAYLRTDVWSPQDQAAQLEMGSDDAVKAWLNAELVFDTYGGGGVTPRHHRVAVQLRKGWNRIMLKVVDHEGSWGVCCRLRKPDGSALPELKVEAR